VLLRHSSRKAEQNYQNFHYESWSCCRLKSGTLLPPAYSMHNVEWYCSHRPNFRLKCPHSTHKHTYWYLRQAVYRSILSLIKYALRALSPRKQNSLVSDMCYLFPVANFPSRNFSHTAILRISVVNNDNTIIFVTKTRKKLLLQNTTIHSDMWSQGLLISPFLNTPCVTWGLQGDANATELFFLHQNRFLATELKKCK